MLSSDLTGVVGLSAAVQHCNLCFPAISVTMLKPRCEHGAATVFSLIVLRLLKLGYSCEV